ncbi:MAG: LytR/AlgR family response regulator transcription factor [Sphingosinicella sp.]|uniref:LytR/AlgR family response regulator transcription factor n=1 Tax=Sphingosinicella sp. TaxID=1917971 RepID=UPI004038007F
MMPGTSMAGTLAVGVDAGWSRRATMAFVALFWLITFLLFSVRALLIDPEAFDLVQANRLVSTGLGAIFFGLAIARLARREADSLVAQARQVLAWAMGAAGAIAVARLAIDLSFDPQTPTVAAALPATLRWLLVWLGYFFAWSGAYLLLRYDRALAAQQALLSRKSSAPHSAPEPETLWAERNRQRVRLPVERIEWVEAEGDYIRLHAGDAGGTIRMTLSAAARMLGPHGFIRVHRSVLCRQGAIVALERTRSGALRAELQGGDKVPVGRRFADLVTGLAQSAAAAAE